MHGPGWLYALGMPPRGYLRLWTPRAHATDRGQGPDLRRGVRAGSLRVPKPRAREKIRGRKRKKCRCPKKTHLHIIIQGSPSVCEWREIPGVTQVDEKGHKGNTAVATAYVGGNMVKETTTIICFEHLLFTCSISLWGIFSGWRKCRIDLSVVPKDCRECNLCSKIDCKSVIDSVRESWRFR